jgi:hypothetical protein
VDWTPARPERDFRPCSTRRNGHGFEHRFRDSQGARYHPMQPGPQGEYAGALALGLPTGKLF